MLKAYFFLSISFLFFGCLNAQKTVYHDLDTSINPAPLIRIYAGGVDEPGEPCGYINNVGDTIIALGKYDFCWTDTLKTFGIVWDESSHGFIGIDVKDRLIYEVYLYDNGPDYIMDGLFRIKRHGKVGYADTEGNIRIQPQFTCASPFSNGQAQVAYNCKMIREGDYERAESEE